jgi:hypothetical protein
MPGNDRYPPRYVRPLPPSSVPFWVSIWLLALTTRSCAQDFKIEELRRECTERGP